MEPFPLTLHSCQSPEAPVTAQALLAQLGKTGHFYLTETGDWLMLDNQGIPQPLKTGRKFGHSLELNGYIVIQDHVLRNIAFIQEFVGGVAEQSFRSIHIPTVRVIVTAPALCFNQDGSRLVLSKIGYDPIAADGTLCVPGSINTDTLPEADPQYPHLKTVFSGFLFVDELYRANLMAIFLASIARTAIKQFPLILIDADRKSSGKSTLANAITYLITGKPATAVTYTGDEKEFEGRFKSIVNKPGPNFILVDNVRAKQGVGGQIRSQLLSSITGGHTVHARTMYAAPAPVYSPVVFMTMNGGRVERDLGDKIVRISLRLPKGAQHRQIDPEPMAYLTKHRRAVFAEALHLLTSIELPPVAGTKWHTRFYDFERVAVAAAKALGLEASFDPGRVVSADSLVMEICHLLHDEFYGAPTTFTELVDRARASQNLRELNEMLRACHRAAKGQAIELRQLIETNYVGQTLRVADAQGELIVEKNAANQYTLWFKENGPADCLPDVSASTIITSELPQVVGTPSA